MSTQPDPNSPSGGRNRRLPKLCIHKTRKLYYVRVHRTFHYLGPVGGPEEERAAEEARLQLFARLAAGGLPGPAPEGPLTIDDLLAKYLTDYVPVHYRNRKGEPTTEQRAIRLAVRPLQRLYGPSVAAEFGPKALKVLRAAMVDGSWMTEADKKDAGVRLRGGGGWSRKVANSNVNRLRRMFRWAVSEELVAPEVATALQTVSPLLAHRTKARETPDTTPPAPEESVEAVLAVACRQVAALMRFQLLTAARPGEACRARPCDLDRSGATLARLTGAAVPIGGCWAYLPGLEDLGQGQLGQDHKKEHAGKRRIVPLGPKAQEVLAPFLEGRAAGDYLFSPAEASAERNAKRRALRKTRVQPSQQNQRVTNPKKLPGKRYTTSSYAHAVANAIQRINATRAAQGLPPLPSFHPHQLRKNAATRIEREFGADVARVVCGHSSVQTTLEFYVARDLEAAFKAAQASG